MVSMKDIIKPIGIWLYFSLKLYIQVRSFLKTAVLQVARFCTVENDFSSDLKETNDFQGQSLT